MSSYVQTILTAVIAFPFIAFLFTFPYIIYNYRKYGSVLSFTCCVSTFLSSCPCLPSMKWPA